MYTGLYILCTNAPHGPATAFTALRAPCTWSGRAQKKKLKRVNVLDICPTKSLYTEFSEFVLKAPCAWSGRARQKIIKMYVQGPYVYFSYLYFFYF
jgi:hypothetical protein